MYKNKFVLLVSMVPLSLLVVPAAQAQEWGGPGFWVGNGGWYHQEAYQNGYYAGTQDAIYDHENNLVYSDQPVCLSCHSQLYLDGFRHGYRQQWNTYHGQSADQGSSINIYGNNNYVNTNQYSNQQQNPLQQLARTVCGFINCNQTLQPQQTSWGP